MSCRLWSLGGCHTFWAMDHVSCRVGCGRWEVATRFGPHVLGDGSCKLSCRLWSLGVPHVLGDGSCKLSCQLWSLGGCHTFWAMDHVSCRVGCGPLEVSTRFGRWIM